MSTDRELLKQTQAGLASSAGLSDPIGEVRKSHEETFVLAQFDAADFAEVGVEMTKACRVVSITALPAENLSTHATNYVTGTVAKRDGAGGSASTIGTYTTNSTGGAALAAFVPTDVTISSPSAAVFAAGNVLTFKQVDAGATGDTKVTVSVTVEYV